MNSVKPFGSTKSLSVSARRRLARLARGHGAFELKVEDTGIGIAEKDLPRAPGPFVQSHSTCQHKHGGTGLGLPVVKSLVEPYGGGFALLSRVGSGTRAVIQFPRERIVAA